MLSIDKVQAIRNRNPQSSLNVELEQLIDYHQKRGYGRLYLDYILRAPFTLEVNEKKFEYKKELTRVIKNAAIEVLQNYKK